MNTFLRFFYEFISIFFGGIVLIFKGLIGGIMQMVNIKQYKQIIDSYKSNFEGSEWLFVGLTIAVLVIILGLISVMLFFAIKKFLKFRKEKITQEDLLDEIVNLNNQVRDLMIEKDNLMAMKVSQLGLKPNEDPNEKTEDAKGNGEEEKNANPNIRFPKLVKIDERLSNYKVKNYGNDFNLEQLIDNFRCFSATHLRLYYDYPLLRAFFGGLACGKLIILQGISGTGKTSLAYAWGKFVKKDSCVAAVQPSWRDKTEMLGYFNEFTKKFNESEVLAELYVAKFDDDIHTIILDEMNIARVEYYFAEMLSILEMPSRDEWIIELVTSPWPEDPKKLNNGKLQLPKNLWYIGTINNDDSTFMVTDKVYDRAMPIDINTKVEPFKCRDQEAMDINSSYLESLFTEAIESRQISEKSLDQVREMDDYVIKHFRVAFGNRIMKQMRSFVPVYVACGGKEVEGIDYFVAKKIFRKFDQLNPMLIRDEIDPFITYLNKIFGKGVMKECIEYLERIKKTM
jgi:hypothetical protein